MTRALTVILNWRQCELTQKCLEHVRRQSHPSSVLVVDNGSGDGSASRLRASHPEIEVVELQDNRGFAGGMNVGLERALEQGFDVVWLLNNDAFAATDCLEKLVVRLQQDPRLAIVGPRLVYEDGRPQACGARLRWDDGFFDVLSADEIAACDSDACYLVGAAPVVRVAALRQVGVFEPSFFAYMEDADLGLRLHRAGTLGIVPDAVAVHALGGTSGGFESPLAQFLLFRNAWLCLSRNAPAGSRLARWCRYVAAALAFVEQCERRKATPVATAVLSAVGAARRGLYGPPPASLFEPARLERHLGKHPYRYRRLLTWSARLLAGRPRRA